MNLLCHRPARESSRVASADQDPWSLVRLDVVPSRHRKLDIVGKVVEIIDGLLYSMEFEILDAQVSERIGQSIIPMFQDNRGTTLLLSDLTIDGLVVEISGISWVRPSVKWKNSVAMIITGPVNLSGCEQNDRAT